MGLIDRFYAGEKSYSVPFICVVLIVGMGLALFAMALMQ